MNWRIVGAFFLGVLACALAFEASSSIEFPLSTGFSIFDSSPTEAPFDHVSDDDIVVLDDRVILKIEGATLSNYADSGSMIPVLDEGANGIRVVPKSSDEIEVGDIVSYRIGSILVVHRVIAKGEDADGVWFDVKGDANLIEDGRIRFEDIEYLTVGVIY